MGITVDPYGRPTASNNYLHDDGRQRHPVHCHTSAPAVEWDSGWTKQMCHSFNKFIAYYMLNRNNIVFAFSLIHMRELYVLLYDTYATHIPSTSPSMTMHMNGYAQININMYTDCSWLWLIDCTEFSRACWTRWKGGKRGVCYTI